MHNRVLKKSMTERINNKLVTISWCQTKSSLLKYRCTLLELTLISIM